MRSNLVDIAGEVRIERDLSFLFFEGTREVWLPKSLCEWDKDEKTMAMPDWLAKDKELI